MELGTLRHILGQHTKNNEQHRPHKKMGINSGFKPNELMTEIWLSITFTLCNPNVVGNGNKCQPKVHLNDKVFASFLKYIYIGMS